MKAVILAGGYGTRISEESLVKPKPLVEICDKPILWHIMKIYSYYGINDFIICCGYKGYCIKEYFANYFLYNSDITFDFGNFNQMTIHNNVSEPWKVTCIDTGLDTQTGGRIKRIKDYVGNDTFLCTYGDGVSDIDINKLIGFHKKNGKIATITAVQPGNKFGVLEFRDNGFVIDKFTEKGKEEGGWINAGFMVLEPQIFDYIDDDATILERKPFERLARKGELIAYKHNGYWQCMDTLRDKILLNELVKNKVAKWIKWE